LHGSFNLFFAAFNLWNDALNLLNGAFNLLAASMNLLNGAINLFAGAFSLSTEAFNLRNVAINLFAGPINPLSAAFNLFADPPHPLPALGGCPATPAEWDTAPGRSNRPLRLLPGRPGRLPAVEVPELPNALHHPRRPPRHRPIIAAVPAPPRGRPIKTRLPHSRPAPPLRVAVRDVNVTGPDVIVTGPDVNVTGRDVNVIARHPEPPRRPAGRHRVRPFAAARRPIPLPPRDGRR
jgi:hypothetical protein